VKARQQIETLAGNGQRRAFTPAVILFIALPEAKDNIDPGVIPLDLLPRRCPICGDHTIIGHGRRLRPAHDDRQERIWVRRGICRPCGKTFTILPDWLAPSGHYTLRCRQQACERIAAGDSAEQAAPCCKDPTRLPDPSPVRRWAQRRLLSLCCWIEVGAGGQRFLRTPTILVWDLGAFCRILAIEARSP
jgi:hypothetical protein